MAINQVVAAIETFAGLAESIAINTTFDPTLGPHNALIYVVMHGESRTLTSVLNVTFAGGNWNLLSRKYKPELSATVEVWQGFGFKSEEGGGVSPVVATFDGTSSAAAIAVIGFTGVEQGDSWLSPPTWKLGTAYNQRLQLRTVDPPATRARGQGTVAQNVFVVSHNSVDAAAIPNAQYVTQSSFGTYRFDVLGSGTQDLAPEAYEGFIETFASSTAVLAVGVSLYSSAFFDNKEGTPPESEDTPEDEMRYKERIAQLERELADTTAAHTQAQDDFVNTNRKLTAEADSYAQALNSTREAASTQIASLKSELASARAELQQTIDAVPHLVAAQLDAHFEQRLNELLANPQLLRELLMQHAQAAQDPNNLFATLQAMQQI